MKRPKIPPVTFDPGTVRCGPVIVKRKTANAKLGHVVTTWVGVRVSCPGSCAQHPDNGGGCYADCGPIGGYLKRLDERWSKLTPHEVALCEVAALDGLRSKRPGRDVLPPTLQGRPLRLHSSGDTTSPASARVIAEAAARYIRRGGGPVWTYTHAWRTVPREAWRPTRLPVWHPQITVIASVDSPDEIPAARAQGYRMFAMIVPEHEDARAESGPFGPIIPCVAQTHHRTCRECKLCFRERDSVITFAAHGVRRRHALEVLR